MLGFPRASELKCSELQQGVHSQCHLDQVTKLGDEGSLFSLSVLLLMLALLYSSE